MPLARRHDDNSHESQCCAGGVRSVAPVAEAAVRLLAAVEAVRNAPATDDDDTQRGPMTALDDRH